MCVKNLFFALAVLGLIGCASGPQPTPCDCALAEELSASLPDIEPLITDRSVEKAFSFDCKMSVAEMRAATDLHLFGRAPSNGSVVARRSFVSEYDRKHRVPRWTAWFASPDYRVTAYRSGPWAAFRDDPDQKNPVTDDDYLGLSETKANLVRGHLAPYYISGGDRDRDGSYAASMVWRKIKGKMRKVRYKLDDPDDACTVYEINYMSNIAPQNHRNFNGVGGLWYQLETTVRDLIDQGYEFHMVAGSIFLDDPKLVGPDKDIGVPDMFYKIILTNDGSIPFLFDHTGRVGAEGCALSAKLDECLSTIQEIEQLTGLRFFRDLSVSERRLFRKKNAKDLWELLLADVGV